MNSSLFIISILFFIFLKTWIYNKLIKIPAYKWKSFTPFVKNSNPDFKNEKPIKKAPGSTAWRGNISRMNSCCSSWRKATSKKANCFNCITHPRCNFCTTDFTPQGKRDHAHCVFIKTCGILYLFFCSSFFSVSRASVWIISARKKFSDTFFCYFSWCRGWEFSCSGRRGSRGRLSCNPASPRTF